MTVFYTSLKSIFSSKHFYIILLFIFAIIIHWPQHDYWPLIVQGDLGRDLYAFQRTQLGDLPYRDYFYIYGPLMPFYYAFFYMIFGVKLTSLILGLILLDSVAGFIIYFILIGFTTPAIALLGASWFWLFYERMSFNFNHIGAVPVMLLNVYLLIKFYQFPKVSTFLGIAATILILLLIKLNLGAAILVSSFVVISILWITGGLKNFPIKLPLLWLILLPATMAALIYCFLLKGLPVYYLKQCFPLSHGYVQFTHHALVLPRLIFAVGYLHFFGLEPNYFSSSIFSNMWPDRILIISLLLAILFYLFNLIKFKKQFSRSNCLAIIILLISMLFLSHEFILLGVPYELWVPCPLFICFFFLIVGIFLKDHPIIKSIWVFIISCTLIIQIVGVYSFKDRLIRSNESFLPWGKMRVYSQTPAYWVITVEETVNYLQAHLAPGEKFLALPYEPIYYWLLDRKSPVIETMFFDFLNIPPVQERRMILDLDKEHVNYIIMSNRVHSPESGLGLFGVTNCPLLADYIDRHFKPVIVFGKWSNTGDWSCDHAIKIFKRVD